MSASVALITGGAKRLGAACARHLAAAGYRVILHAHRSRDEAEALAASLRSEGADAAVISGDLADLAALEALMVEATACFGPVTLLVNNASVFERDEIGTVTPDGLAAALAINLQAPILLAQAFAAQVPPLAEGVIINMIDQRVLKPNPQFFSYSLSKSALYWATRTLAQALAPRIRVNAIGPGPTLPNVHDGPDLFQQEVAGTLLGRAVSPEAIAETLLFLARAPHVTGQMLAVDSGQHLTWQTPDLMLQS